MLDDETRAWACLMWCAGMPQERIADACGTTRSRVNTQIVHFIRETIGVDVQIHKLYTAERKIEAAAAFNRYARQHVIRSPSIRFGKPMRPPAFPRMVERARYEHAWLLRAEGVKYTEIGPRLGVTPGRARQLVLTFGYRFVRRAMRHCRVSIT